jgi:hypothetical protein
MRGLIAVCVVVVLGGSANAQKQHGGARGAGVASCAEFATGYQKDPDFAEVYFLSWAFGYMSGVNAAAVDLQLGSQVFDLGSKTQDEMKRYLRRYCDEHPSANYGDGVVELVKTLPVVPLPKQ